MTIPTHTKDDRRERAQRYLEDAAFAKGVARGFNDIAEHLKATFTPGSDPARRALAAAITNLGTLASQSNEFAGNCEGRAKFLTEVLGS